ESIGLGKPQGALVRGVKTGSPGAKGGIEAGDIILKFDGTAIDKPSDLPRLVGNTKPGTKSTVTVFRRGKTRDLTVTVAELEPDKPARVPGSREEPTPSSASAAAKSLGLAVSELSAERRQELKLRGGVRVDAASEAAARAGLREGDGILAVGNVEEANVSEFAAALAKIDRAKPVSVLFRRREWAQYALIRHSRRA